MPSYQLHYTQTAIGFNRLTFPELKRFSQILHRFFANNQMFNEKIESVVKGRSYSSNAFAESLSIRLNHHPHFKNPGFVERYARALAKAIEDSKCKPDNRCINELAKQLKEDSKTGPQYYCRKVLQEGQACCSAPNKSCGNFTFAKEITSTFAKSVPGLLSSFAQFLRRK